MAPSRWEEFELLRRLRATPEMFERLRQESGPELARQQRLRGVFPDDLVRGALTLEELRGRAADRFAQAGRMWFDRTGLEQATTEAVARHKARRFEGQGRTWDLCCGIGSDALALATRGEVVAVDSNPAQCLRAGWNAEVHGVEAGLHPVCADVERLALPEEPIHIDPDRRPGGRARSIRLEECVPGLSFLQGLAESGKSGAIKVSPAANFPGKFPGAEIELISLDGECKEATVWFGELGEADLWRATILRTGRGAAANREPTVQTLSGRPLDWVADLAPLGRFLYDPDPAVVRAGLIDRLAVDRGLSRLDGAEEYLTADRPVETPFAQSFEVLAELPWRDKEVRAWLRANPVHSIEIKCRHVPVNADEVRRKLPREGSDPVVLVVARIGGRTRAVICRRRAADVAAGQHAT